MLPKLIQKCPGKVSRKSKNCRISEMQNIFLKIVKIPGTEIPGNKFSKMWVYFARFFSFLKNSGKCYSIRHCKFLEIVGRMKSAPVSPYLIWADHWLISSRFARTLKVLEFENQNSRPWKSVKSTLGPWKTLKFAAWLFSLVEELEKTETWTNLAVIP